MTGDASENTVPIDNTLRQFISNNDMLEIMSSLIDGPDSEFANIMIPRERDFRGVENMIMMPPPIRNSLIRFITEGNRSVNNTLARSLLENSGIKKVLSEKGLDDLKKVKYKSETYKNTRCPILYVDFKEGDEVTVLPCKHCFDSEAILHWLKEEKAECPVCRLTLDSKEKSQNLNQENQENQENEEDIENIEHLQNREALVNSIRRVNTLPINLEESREFFREQLRLNHPMWPEEEDLEDLQQAILLSLEDNN